MAENILSDRARLSGTREQKNQVVRAVMESHGYTMIGDYKNRRTKIKYRCSKGHEGETGWQMLKTGNGCMICGHASVKEKNSHSQSDVEDFIAQGGSVLLSEYKGISRKITVQCAFGHIEETTLTQIKRASSCLTCYNTFVRDRSEAARLRGVTMKPIYEKRALAQFQALGYEALSPFLGCSIKMKYRCDKGHFGSVTPQSLNQGTECRECRVIERSQKYRLGEKKAREVASSLGFEIVSEFETFKAPVYFRCSSKHVFRRALTGLKANPTCPKCRLRRSAFIPDRPATLYYLRFIHPVSGDGVYKIGITHRTAAARFSREATEWSRIFSKRFKDGDLCRKVEREIIKRFRHCRYKGADFLDSGNTELFTMDVLRSDINSLAPIIKDVEAPTPENQMELFAVQ